MKLTPKEQDRLTIFTLAELARKRRARGIKLNHPEAVALICDEVMEEARAGRGYDEVVAHGMQVLTEEDVMEGVAELASTISVEPLFDDGTKLVVLHKPIRKVRAATQKPVIVSEPALPGTITINAGKTTLISRHSSPLARQSASARPSHGSIHTAASTPSLLVRGSGR